jgi:hypothetical protein
MLLSGPVLPCDLRQAYPGLQFSLQRMFAPPACFAPGIDVANDKVSYTP